MDLRSFAQAERLKLRKDEDGSLIVPGKKGHLWEYGDCFLAVTLLELTPRKWSHRRKLCLEAGMHLHQDGDFEGTCLFDPSDPTQVEVAIRVAEIKRRRIPSTAQLEVLARAREASPIMRRSPSSGFKARARPGRGLNEERGTSAVSFSGEGSSEAV
jgi:hypothetical protein